MISIITCVLNAEQTIERTIKSVINQSYSEIEYLVIDGGSTDRTLDIVGKYKDSISYVISESDQGLYSAMNRGASNAKGDYLYFLNADDWLCNNKIIKWVNSILVAKRPDILFGNTVLIYSDYQVEVSRRFSNRNFKRGVIPPHQGSFINKSLFNEIGGFDEDLKTAADLDLFIRLKQNPLFFLEIDRSIAFVSSGGVSSIKKNSYLEVVNIIERNYGKVPAVIYWGKKIVLEQGLKRILKQLGLQRTYQVLARINNKVRFLKS